MKHWQTLIGILVLAVVAAVALGVRLRPDSPARHRENVLPGVADDTLPDLTRAQASTADGDITFTATLSPQPPVAFAKTRVRVRAERHGMPVSLGGATIQFEMSMPMGDQTYSLLPAEDGWLAAVVTLPRCMSGKLRWYATVKGTAGDRPVKARFRLDLTPPPA